MGKFEDTVTKAKEFFGETGKMAEEAIKVQKLRFEISSKKSALSKVYATLGRYAYKNAVDGDENAEQATKLISVITDKRQEIMLLEEKLALYRGYTTCSCGASNKDGSKYCNGCGKEL